MSQLIPKSTQLIVDNFCGRCGNGLLAQDNFCRHCGTQANAADDMVWASAVEVESSSTSLTTTNQNQLGSSAGTVTNHNQQLSSPADTVQTVLNNRLYIGIIIALIGPLGLPALWFSPRFSKRTKIVLTSLFVFMTTVVPLAVAWYFLDYSLRPVLDVLAA